MLFKLPGIKTNKKESKLKKVLNVVVKLFAMPLGAVAIYTIISSFEDKRISVINIATIVFFIVVLALALSNKTEHNSLQ